MDQTSMKVPSNFVNFTEETAIKMIKLVDQLLAKQLSEQTGMEITVETIVYKKGTDTAS